MIFTWNKSSIKWLKLRGYIHVLIQSVWYMYYTELLSLKVYKLIPGHVKLNIKTNSTSNRFYGDGPSSHMELFFLDIVFVTIGRWKLIWQLLQKNSLNMFISAAFLPILLFTLHKIFSVWIRVLLCPSLAVHCLSKKSEVAPLKVFYSWHCSKFDALLVLTFIIYLHLSEFNLFLYQYVIKICTRTNTYNYKLVSKVPFGKYYIHYLFFNFWFLIFELTIKWHLFKCDVKQIDKCLRIVFLCPT